MILFVIPFPENPYISTFDLLTSLQPLTLILYHYDQVFRSDIIKPFEIKILYHVSHVTKPFQIFDTKIY
jgi:hypothetical protein